MTIQELESIRQDLMVQCNIAIADYLWHRKNIEEHGCTRITFADDSLTIILAADTAMAALYHALQAMSTEEQWEDYLASNPQTKELRVDTWS